MNRNNDEPEFRLRPPKPKVQREGSAWAHGFKLLMHHARASRAGKRRASGGGNSGIHPGNQRCVVRITYSKNRTPGQWRAHGRYLARDSAGLTPDSKATARNVGFDGEHERLDVSAELERWQGSRDPLLWKFIISPEFGERADLPQLTRDLVQKMEKDLGTHLEWVAVTHHNTQHPHVHVAVRGIRADGTKLRLSRDYIRRGVRAIAEDMCTKQLGYRSELDAQQAERREITEHRFTSLDRFIKRMAVQEDMDILKFERPAVDSLRSKYSQIREQYAIGRLNFLESMGLAASAGPGTWQIQGDFETVLRAMQRTNDHQKTLAAHGVIPSDPRLAIQTMNWDNYPNGVLGRILVHGQDEASGRGYLMLEGTNALIHFIPYAPEMESARSQGALRTNSLVKFRRYLAPNRRALLEIQELGNADALLKKPSHFTAEAQQLLEQGTIPTEDGWGGWLGQYQIKLCEAASQLMNQKAQERSRPRDNRLGR